MTVLTGMATVVAIHFLWAGRTYRRLFWFDMIAAYLLMAFFWLTMFGLFQPLATIMQQLGK